MKNVELAAASERAEALLKDISASTAVAEKEKARVAVIVDAVTKKAAVRRPSTSAKGVYAEFSRADAKD